MILHEGIVPITDNRGFGTEGADEFTLRRIEMQWQAGGFVRVPYPGDHDAATLQNDRAGAVTAGIGAKVVPSPHSSAPSTPLSLAT